MTVALLDTPARDYAWGSPTAIPALLGEPPTGAPVAEVWIGAHPGAPSRLGGTGLDELVAAAPAELLGGDVAARFGRLPFLLKLLAADRALSLQVHPDLAQARDGFAREDAAGIAVGASHRNYQDDNHKPELLCALTPFTALCGFREPASTAALLTAFGRPSLGSLVELVRGATTLRPAVEYLLALDTAAATPLVADLAAGAAAYVASAPAGEWSAEAAVAVSLAAQSPREPGPLVAMLLNLVTLQPGEAVFLAAGEIHAYVEGFGVEIMSTSDNVLRCGMTPKHVDVAELVHVASFEPVPGDPWPVLHADWGGIAVDTYRVPVADFQLQRLEFPGNDELDLEDHGPTLLLATSGTLAVTSRGGASAGRTSPGLVSPSGTSAGLVSADGTSPGSVIGLRPGRAAFVPGGETVRITGPGTLFRATVASP